jgi:nucleoside-diphosphate-sugar epimerase
VKVVVIGATGNVGTSVVEALRSCPQVSEVQGVARRLPGPTFLARAKEADGPRLSWRAADIRTDPLDFFAGADAVVHLAWQIQPSRDVASMRRTNVDGTGRIARAAIAHGVPRLVYASSVGAYSTGPKHRPVDESWPVDGIATSTYSRHKAQVEHDLDQVERQHPELAVVRMRTSLVFQRRAASEVHRLFLGRLAPWHLPRLARFIPSVRRLVFQATCADDVADAYAKAVTSDARGPFNIAADPPLTPQRIAEVCDGRTLALPPRLLRGAVAGSYALHLQPAEAGWFDMALETPLMDSSRARVELGWSAKRSSTDALAELLAGIGEGAGTDTAPLHPRRSSPPRGDRPT